MSVQQVLADVDPALAYTTVMTILSRLHAKNAVTREQAGRAFVYSLPGGPDGARASMTAYSMHRLLDQGDDRRRVLSRFIEDLGPADEKLLRRMLDGQPAPRPSTSEEGLRVAHDHARVVARRVLGTARTGRRPAGPPGRRSCRCDAVDRIGAGGRLVRGPGGECDRVPGRRAVGAVGHCRALVTGDRGNA